MKSGTNWLGNLLSSHPDVGCVGEFHWQNVYAGFAQNLRTLTVYRDYESRQLTETARVAFESMVRVCLDQAIPEKKILGERTPHTLEPLILRDAPHITIVRDGRDVLVSRAFHLFNYPEVHRLFERIPSMAKDFECFRQNPWFFREHPEMLLRHEMMVRESVRWWREHLVADRKTLEKHPFLNVKILRYEDLHDDAGGQRDKLLQFLGADPTSAPPIAGDLKAGFADERPDQFLRKGKIGDWRNYFTDQTKRWFKEAAQDELIEQDYETGDDW
jgi:hypothetical protein